MTVRRGALPALLAGALVAAAAVASGGLVALLAALPPLLIAFALFLGRTAGVDALVELADALDRRGEARRAATTSTPAPSFDLLPLSARPVLGGASRRGPPLASSPRAQLAA